MSHRINHGWSPNRNDPQWERRVEREAQKVTDATERRWHRANRRLAAARAREATARARQDHADRVAKLAREVEERIRELAEIERGMKATPAGSQKRGRGGYRGVTAGTGILARAAGEAS